MPAERKKVASRGKAPVGTAAPPVRAPLHPGSVLVREVMQRDVVVLHAEDSIRTAAEQFEEVAITGAPVVDAAERLVGVLTVSDIARSEHVSEHGVQTQPEGRAPQDFEGSVDESGVDEEQFPTEDYDDEVLGRTRVGDWMTPRVVHLGPRETIKAACRLMLDEGIHRVFVVDDGKLVGVVSSEDIVRLLAETG